MDVVVPAGFTAAVKVDAPPEHTIEGLAVNVVEGSAYTVNDVGFDIAVWVPS